MTFDSCVMNDVQVLTPRKNLVGGVETTSLTDAIVRLAAGGAPRVVLDLGKISWVSSLGIAGMLRARRSCVDGHGWLRLACQEKRIKSTILALRLPFMFDTFDTVEDAVAAGVRESHAS